MLNFHIITLFPESFTSYLGESIIARAIKNKKIKVSFYNPRDFVMGKYRKVWPDGGVMAQADDRPYGGGPGMVLRAEPILKAVETALRRVKSYELGGKKKKLEAGSRKLKANVILLTPSGKQFTNAEAEKLKKQRDIVIICGRYEGIDARVKKILKATLSTKALASVEEYSVGPYVLTGGELPSMIMIDSISRRLPGVLGKTESLEENRVSTSEVYTRPEMLTYNGKKYRVPKILLSGHQKKIEEWKAKRTR